MGEQSLSTVNRHFGVMANCDNPSTNNPNKTKRCGDFFDREEEERRGTAAAATTAAAAARSPSSGLPGSFIYTSSRKRQRSQSPNLVEKVDSLWDKPSFRDIPRPGNLVEPVDVISTGQECTDQSSPSCVEVVGNVDSDRNVPLPPRQVVARAGKAMDYSCLGRGVNGECSPRGSDSNEIFSESPFDRSHRMAYLSSRGYLLNDSLMRVMDASVYEDDVDSTPTASQDESVVSQVSGEYFSPVSPELDIHIVEPLDERRWLGQVGVQQVAV